MSTSLISITKRPENLRLYYHQTADASSYCHLTLLYHKHSVVYVTDHLFGDMAMIVSGAVYGFAQQGFEFRNTGAAIGTSLECPTESLDAGVTVTLNCLQQ